MKTIQQISTEELKNLLKSTLESHPFEEYNETAYVAINQEILRREKYQNNLKDFNER